MSLTREERIILREAARIRSKLQEMPKGIARDPASDLRKTSIADLRAEAGKLGIDVSAFGRNKRLLMKAIEDAERVDVGEICEIVDKFCRRIGADLTERCTQKATKRLDFVWRHWDLSKEVYTEGDDEYDEWRVKDEENLVISWERKLREKLLRFFGDAIKDVELWRGDKNYIEGSVILW